MVKGALRAAGGSADQKKTFWMTDSSVTGRFTTLQFNAWGPGHIYKNFQSNILHNRQNWGEMSTNSRMD